MKLEDTAPPASDAARPEIPVHLLAERFARETPAATALDFDEGSWTFAELDRAASAIAVELERLGAPADAPCALLSARTPWFVAAEFATLKAGASFLPLDIGYPDDRIASILAESGAQLIVTDEPGRVAALARPGMKIIDLAAFSINGQTPSLPSRSTHPDGLAYVIYTSGSTGKPKGVAISHRGLAALCRWHREHYHLQPSDRGSSVASLGFDAAVWEIWPYLSAGASVHLYTGELDPARLPARLAASGVTIMFLASPLAEAALQTANDWPKPLRALLTGADRLRIPPPPGLPIDFVNHYGPTETSVIATAGIIRSDEAEAPPPIGTSISSCQVYLLDEQLAPTPDGAEGQLYIGGPAVARGYLNRPGLTAERFLPDPFSSDGSRMYDTGDLAVRLADGRFAFRGRSDGQVKIRGYRIELGEIEAALHAENAVSHAAVIVDKGQLVAFVVNDVSSPPDLRRLEQSLGRTLPPWMVPSEFVSLDMLPLNANGKIDRDLLPSLRPKRHSTAEWHPEAEAVDDVVDDDFAPLGAIVAELLAVPSVAPTDDFFALGGDSLLALQVVARVRDRLGFDLAFEVLFETETIGDWLEHIEAPEAL